jgi:hypothetical protein
VNKKSICASHGLWKRISAELVVESPQSVKEKSRTEVRGYARGESTKSESAGLKTVTSEAVVLSKCYKKKNKLWSERCNSKNWS